MPRKIFPLKLSDAERQALNSQAAAAGLNPSTYLRLLIEKDSPKPSGARVGGLLEKAKPGRIDGEVIGKIILGALGAQFGLSSPAYAAAHLCYVGEGLSRYGVPEPLPEEPDEAAADAGFDFGPG